MPGRQVKGEHRSGAWCVLGLLVDNVQELLVNAVRFRIHHLKEFCRRLVALRDEELVGDRPLIGKVKADLSSDMATRRDPDLPLRLLCGDGAIPRSGRANEGADADRGEGDQGDRRSTSREKPGSVKGRSERTLSAA